MNWLITGGCGFIGRALIAKLLKDCDNRVRVLDNLSVGTRAELSATAQLTDCCDSQDWLAPLTFFEGDIRDRNMARKACVGAEVVIHLAANTGVGPSVEDPWTDCETNVFGTLNMLEGCRLESIRRFVFASSGAPLGEQMPPLNENMAPRPASPYGASKLAGEGYCSAYYHCFGLETVALRFGNVYGEGSGHKQSVVAKFIKQAIQGETLELYGDGTQTRDFIHISDLVNAIIAAARSHGVGGEVFQIATSHETTVSELTEKLIAAMQAEGMIIPKTCFGEKRNGDVMRNYSDTSKALRQLDWQARVSLHDGLRRTIKYFIETKAI